MNQLKLLRLIFLLDSRGCVDCRAVALMLTEMRFRGPLFRCCEILYTIWLLYGLGLEPTTTIGKSQVAFSYWRRRFGFNNLAIIRGSFADIESYDVCCDYLHANECPTIRQLLQRYNGRPSVLYVRLFYENLRRSENAFAIIRRQQLRQPKSLAANVGLST